MLLPLACLKRDFLKVLQSLRGYIDTILTKSLGHIARVAYRQACPEAVVHGSIYKETIRHETPCIRNKVLKILKHIGAVHFTDINQVPT